LVQKRDKVKTDYSFFVSMRVGFTFFCPRLRQESVKINDKPVGASITI